MQLRLAGVWMMEQHMLLAAFPDFVLIQLRRGKNLEVNRVIQIVTVIGYLVGEIGDLRFERRKAIFALVLLQTFADFERQIQSGKIRIRVFEQLDDAQTLAVVLEAAVLAHALGENFFAGMSEWSVAEIVRKRDRLRQVFVERESARDGAADRSDFY